MPELLDTVDLAGIAADMAAKFSRLPREDAEDATQEAALEVHTLAEREPLEGSAEALIRQRARWRLLTRVEGRTDLSVDEFLEGADDGPPRELAVCEDDLDSHVRLREIADNPILRMRLESVRAGGGSTLAPRGTEGLGCLYSDDVVAEARRLREQEGLSHAKIADRLGVKSEMTIARWCDGSARATPSRPGWDRDLVLLSIKVFAEEEGRPPTERELKRDRRLPTLLLVERLFGRWGVALAAAGYPYLRARATDA